MKELSVIIKADTDGSIQALADGLMKIQNEEVKVLDYSPGRGSDSETDVLLDGCVRRNHYRVPGSSECECQAPCRERGS